MLTPFEKQEIFRSFTYGEYINYFRKNNQLSAGPNSGQDNTNPFNAIDEIGKNKEFARIIALKMMQLDINEDFDVDLKFAKGGWQLCEKVSATVNPAFIDDSTETVYFDTKDGAKFGVSYDTMEKFNRYLKPSFDVMLVFSKSDANDLLGGYEENEPLYNRVTDTETADDVIKKSEINEAVNQYLLSGELLPMIKQAYGDKIDTFLSYAQNAYHSTVIKKSGQEFAETGKPMSNESFEELISMWRKDLVNKLMNELLAKTNKISSSPLVSHSMDLMKKVAAKLK